MTLSYRSKAQSFVCKSILFVHQSLRFEFWFRDNTGLIVLRGRISALKMKYPLLEQSCRSLSYQPFFLIASGLKVQPLLHVQ